MSIVKTLKKSNHFKDKKYKMTCIMSSMKAAFRQVSNDLKKSGHIKGQSPPKRNKAIEMFSLKHGLVKPDGISAKEWIINLYFDNEFKLLGVGKQRSYSAAEWRRLRIRVFEMYGYNCMICGIIEQSMHVDHIKPYSRFPELSLDINNLQVLCRKHNLEKGVKTMTDYRPINNRKN